MLVYQLLLTFAINHDSEIIERFNIPAQLKTVHQVNGDRDIFFPQMVQERILNVDRLFHVHYPLKGLVCYIFGNC